MRVGGDLNMNKTMKLERILNEHKVCPGLRIAFLKAYAAWCNRKGG